MASPIVVSFGGKESRFDFTKVERDKLYGTRRRVPLDGDGLPCQRAALTEDGRFLLRPGMTAQAWLTPSGRWVPSGELQGFDAEGRPVPRQESTLGVAQELVPARPQDVLDLRLTSVYQLDVQQLDDALKDALSGGTIFRFAFNYRADWHAEVAFLVQNAAGLFALVGTVELPEWLEPTAAPPPLAEDADDFGSDLDFEMF